MKKLRVLIVGYGSIGKRHREVLSRFNEVSEIHLVTSQNLVDTITYKNIESVPLNDYDYIIIASETAKHFEQLSFLIRKVDKKLILCEKPLFHEYIEFYPDKNSVFVGYVLRYHPVIKRIREILSETSVLAVSVYCGSYLPEWRPDRDYRQTYSAKKSMGGGVVLDLSHEIDYIQFLFGKISEIKSYSAKISDLDIDSEDYSSTIGKTEKGVYFSMTLDYISKIPIRKIIVHTNSETFIGDLFENYLLYKKTNGLLVKESFEGLTRNYVYEQMHRDILNERLFCCNYLEALDVLRIVDKIKGV
ncbi:MAG: Gfo/Idh/MocA family oxidoreductase [Thermodesulfovibrio sp.]|nr:Gfo/Idh/MocA family oxidoreductase [Thermodesulfovibrio sp.]MDW7998296.1 Gfo/Idh/MocA family oxidoreductase [Thermodesulfovibrio sp.]